MFVWLVALLHIFSFKCASASQFGTAIGDAAVSQLLRHAANKLLEEARTIELVLTTNDAPSLPPLARLDVASRVSYRNLTVHFREQAVHVVVDWLRVVSQTNISDVFWPLGLADEVLDLNFQIRRSEVRLNVDEESMSLRGCLIDDPIMHAAVRDHWIADNMVSLASTLLNPVLDSTLCSVMKHYMTDVRHSDLIKLPIYNMLPPKARTLLTANNITLFYRLKSIHISEHQMTARAQLDWTNSMDSEVVELLDTANTTQLEMELSGDDVITLWVEDSVINDLLHQVDWNFEWMNEKIPVDSPVIPPDSRDFLATLCSACYFQVSVGARGQPTLTATNSSSVLEKRDRVHLQVVNPDKNVTSVFVSFLLTIVAEVRPTFDQGILRTLVQLLDTNIEMEAGAFPKTWGFFMQDLMRGMIMDMLWPEMKNAIEEVSYGKGLRIPNTCGIDPNDISLHIDEGNFALTSRLKLDQLNPEKCVEDMKSSLPNTSKLFQKLDR